MKVYIVTNDSKNLDLEIPFADKVKAFSCYRSAMRQFKAWGGELLYSCHDVNAGTKQIYCAGDIRVELLALEII